MIRTHVNIIQVLVAIISELILGVIGFAIGAPLGAYSDIQLGLVRGYEVTGALVGSFGLMLGAVFGVWIVACLSKNKGSLLWCVVLSSVGAVFACVGSLWLIPGMSLPITLVLIAVLATLGWNITIKTNK